MHVYTTHIHVHAQLCVNDIYRIQFEEIYQDYCAEPSPTSSAREDIAACPAAVAASLERFLSASATPHELAIKRAHYHITHQLPFLVQFQPRLLQFQQVQGSVHNELKIRLFQQVYAL